MHAFVSTLFALLVHFVVVSPKVVVVNVGHNTTENPGSFFDPPTVIADRGDVVYFNFTQGNHTVTQSVFAAPCMHAHDFSQTINGFDSGFRNAGNYNAITNLQVPIDSSNVIWYFDWNTCSTGGVGAVNVNESSAETYDGFVRNALRLNGTESTTTSLSSSMGSLSIATASSTAGVSSHTSNASRAAVLGTSSIFPLVFLALVLLS